MTPERYQQIKRLFAAALDLDATARTVFLQQACGTDAELRAEVETLLLSHEAAEYFIEAPAAALASLPTLAEQDTGEADSRAEIGQRIGAYEILRELGTGGMGVVYLARRADEQFQQRVAIKLIRRGFASDFAVRRFRSERQILASLNHPNIARLLDGGMTHDEIPYLVMEYIEGQSLDVYCEAHKLSLGARLKLFQQVCDAVQYAHQNLIVHRDLKPGNILVTENGAPKLLDFGIAKLLQNEIEGEAADATMTGMKLMTPGYASPEQARGATITTASDVYSLGCILYELLTGHRPYHVSSLSPLEVIRVICEQEPLRPSGASKQTRKDERGRMSAEQPANHTANEKGKQTHPSSFLIPRSMLRGDLDNIVLMALRKDPAQRYASARELAEDIRRHLEGLPVLARPQTLTYRAVRFARRYRGGVLAAALVLLALLGGLLTTLWQARVARAERARAEQRFNDVRKLARTVMFDLHDAIQNLPGSTPARELLVKNALEYLNSLSQEAGTDASLQRELATAYEKVGDIQGNPYGANLGDGAGALASYRRSLALRETILQAQVNDTAAQLELAQCLLKLGSLSESTDGTDAALQMYQRALQLCETVAAKQPQNTRAQDLLLDCYEGIGDAMYQKAEYTQSLAWQQKRLAIVEALYQADRPATEKAKYRRWLALTLRKIALARAGLGEKAVGLETARQALAHFEALAAADPNNAKAQRELAVQLNAIGDVLWEQNDLAGALDCYRRGLKLTEALSGTDPNNVQLRRSVVASHGNVGYVLAQKGDAPGAEEHYQKSFAILAALQTANAAAPGLMDDFMRNYAFYGDVNKMLAAQVKARSQQITYWKAARDAYQRSLQFTLQVKGQGLLRTRDAGQEENLRQEIANCEKRLTALGAQN